MELFLCILFVVGGLLLIIKGADWFVDSAVWIATKLKVSPVIIGATIVSVGTTLPELMVSCMSALEGRLSGDLVALQQYSGMAVGNSIGSVLCNMGVILAIAFMIKPSKIEDTSYEPKAIMLLGVLGLFAYFIWNGSTREISTVEAFILLGLFIFFIAWNVLSGIKTKVQTEETTFKHKPATYIILFLIGAGLIALGANLLVENAEILAVDYMKINPQVVSITILAIGTSLPELVTSVTAARKGNVILGIGNVLGANIINLTLILSSVTFITGSTLPIDAITAKIIIWACVSIGVIGFLPTIIKNKTTRWQGLTMIAIYATAIIINILYIFEVISL